MTKPLNTTLQSLSSSNVIIHPPIIPLDPSKGLPKLYNDNTFCNFRVTGYNIQGCIL